MDVSKELGRTQKFFGQIFQGDQVQIFLVPLLESCEKLTKAKVCMKGKGVGCTKAMIGYISFIRID